MLTQAFTSLWVNFWRKLFLRKIDKFKIANGERKKWWIKNRQYKQWNNKWGINWILSTLSSYIIIDSKRSENLNFFEKKNAMNIESLKKFDQL